MLTISNSTTHHTTNTYPWVTIPVYGSCGVVHMLECLSHSHLTIQVRHFITMRSCMFVMKYSFNKGGFVTGTDTLSLKWAESLWCPLLHDMMLFWITSTMKTQRRQCFYVPEYIIVSYPVCEWKGCHKKVLFLDVEWTERIDVQTMWRSTSPPICRTRYMNIHLSKGSIIMNNKKHQSLT